MGARKNSLLLVAAALPLAFACGDGDGSDTIVLVECEAGAGGSDDPGGAPSGHGGQADAGSGGAAETPGGGAAGDVSAGAGGSPGTPATSSSLQITINNRPAQAEIAVVVTGPSGFAQTTSTSVTLYDLVPGDYTVQALPARVDGPLVDELFGATVSDDVVAIAEDEAAVVSVDYSTTKLGGSGMLWVSNAGNHALLGYSAAQMALNGAVTADPSVTLTLPALGSADAVPGPVAFDPFTGNLWVGYCGTGIPATLAAFAPDSLEATGDVTPLVELSVPADEGHVCVTALTFDAEGNLWAGFYFNWFARYTRTMLAASGAPAPAAELFEYSTTGIQDLVFDGLGNLFVSGYVSSYVGKYLPLTLLQSSDDALAAVGWQGGGVNGPTGMAFDQSGNLWVANYDSSTLKAFSPVTQATSGDPVTAEQITSADVSGPQYISFDEAGNLWVTEYDDGELVRLNAADLTSDTPISAGAIYTSPDMSLTNAVRLNPPANGN
ncbi:MAG TPA: hypothetical protein VM686_36850 [Polyangiaceae bacterium]|nr:hypothetical protein [Polyangiaceae bacterium]